MALEKAIITNTASGERIPVLFNPEEYTVNQNNNFAQTAVPGLSAPILQFVHGNMRTLEMELLVDSFEEHRMGEVVLNEAGDDVRNLTNKITDLLKIDPSIHAPPVLLFVWASLSFTCVLARVSQQFIMFSSDGTPLRARLQVTFNEFRNVEMEAKEIKRETADYTKHCELGPGETLSSVSARIYRDPRKWRVIALHNGIEEPRKLREGQSVAIPKLPFRDADTGREWS